MIFLKASVNTVLCLDLNRSLFNLGQLDSPKPFSPYFIAVDNVIFHLICFFPSVSLTKLCN
jgi:hypothetical protein